MSVTSSKSFEEITGTPCGHIAQVVGLVILAAQFAYAMLAWITISQAIARMIHARRLLKVAHSLFPSLPPLPPLLFAPDTTTKPPKRKMGILFDLLVWWTFCLSDPNQHKNNGWLQNFVHFDHKTLLTTDFVVLVVDFRHSLFLRCYIINKL